MIPPRLAALCLSLLAAPAVAADPLGALGDFVAKYHEKPDPDAVPRHLKAMLADEVADALDEDTRQIAAHSFGHIGRVQPKLVRVYEEHFDRAGEPGKVLLARVLGVCGDADTVALLNKWEAGTRSRQVKRELLAARRAIERPKRVLPRDQKAETPNDLDLLWVDFFVTGEYAPVSRLLDVFDGPDQMRTAIEEYLKTKPTEKDRKELFAVLGKLGLLDGERLKAGNLDTLVDVKQLSTAFRLARETLGVPSEDLQAGLLVRGTAAWSMQSNLKQHPRLRELIRENLEKRTPGVRMLVRGWLDAE